MEPRNAERSSSLSAALADDEPVIAVELRPPRAELDAAEGMDAWIDTYHAVRGLTRAGRRVFLTDSAVGTQEENNLRHLITNIGDDVPRSRIAPFLTSKHSLEFCLSYANRAWEHGFESLVVLGGDKTIGRPRCLEHAAQLRQAIRVREPRLTLGGWANPHANASQQADFLLADDFTAEFYLTQIVSHLDLAPVERFLNECGRRGVRLPGMFGVFYYRSANRKTLETLSRFIPLPLESLLDEFARGATPIDLCVRTIRVLRRLGVKHIYISNVPLASAASTVQQILKRVDG